MFELVDIFFSLKPTLSGTSRAPLLEQYEFASVGAFIDSIFIQLSRCAI